MHYLVRLLFKLAHIYIYITFKWFYLILTYNIFTNYDAILSGRVYAPSPWQEELPLPDDILLLDGSGVDTTNCNKEEKASSSVKFFNIKQAVQRNELRKN